MITMSSRKIINYRKTNQNMQKEVGEKQISTFNIAIQTDKRVIYSHFNSYFYFVHTTFLF